MRRPTPERVAAEVAALAATDRAQLMERWQELYGTAPPAHTSRDLLCLGIAYRIQEQVHASLARRIRRQLERLAELGPGTSRQLRIKPGTRLLREWQGTVHEVMVLEKGALYQGRTYRSLSEVAEAITGAHRSGPLFFGLKRRERRHARA